MNHTDTDALLTLGEAIARLRGAEDPAGEVTSGMSSNAASAFDMHDAVHVLFGCGTSLEDEIAAHVWMKFATTAKVSEMHRAVAQDEHRKALSGLGHVKVLSTWLRMLPRIFQIIARARRMKKRIGFEKLAELKEQPITAILDEHGIERCHSRARPREPHRRL